MRIWKAEIVTTGGVAGRESVISSFKTYKMRDIPKVLKATRDVNALPKRKISPITTYILEKLIQEYFENSTRLGDTLRHITIEEGNEN